MLRKMKKIKNSEIINVGITNTSFPDFNVENKLPKKKKSNIFSNC
jgi:hypothetical protein